jgi:hypothetical protein
MSPTVSLRNQMSTQCLTGNYLRMPLDGSNVERLKVRWNHTTSSRKSTFKLTLKLIEHL